MRGWAQLNILTPHHTHIHTSNLLRTVPPGRVAQSVGHLTRKSGVLGSIPGLATYFRFSFRFFSKRAVVSYWRKYVHEVLVNRLGGLSLPRKSVVRLTDRPDMTLDVYRGRKTTMQQCNNNGPFQGGTSVVVPRCNILLSPCVYDLQQYGHMNNTFPICFLFCLEIGKIRCYCCFQFSYGS